MKNYTLKLLSLTLLLVSFTALNGCQEKDPSLLKIYLRTADGNIVSDVDIILIADEYSTPEYNDEQTTNQSGFALFDLDMHFKTYGKEAKAGDFKINARVNGVTYLGTVRARGYTTTEETFYLD